MKQAIAISGFTGAGSTTTAKLLAARLKLNHFSPGNLFKDIAKGSIQQQYYYRLLCEICAKKKIALKEYCGNKEKNALEFWATPLGKNPKFHEAIDELQKQLAEEGGIIVDGKLSFFAAPKAYPKIWLKADINERVRRIAQRENLSIEEALTITNKRQRTERHEWKSIYNLDVQTLEKKADLIIDTTKNSTDETVKEILTFLEKSQYKEIVR